MSSSKGNLSKFILKPSSLSQHTANFNKILEQVPVPHRIEKLELESNKSTIESNKTDNKEQVNPNIANQEFLFGEKLSDRVVVTKDDKEETTSMLNKTLENEDINKPDELNLPQYYHEQENHESEQESTLIKINCKLYLLDNDKTNWLERGYGMLKVIETNEKANCKIMMWTDKCYRLILNTKLFEHMTIDKANKKSIRFSGYDSGNVKIYLAKTANTNDCDELYDILKARLMDLQQKALYNKDTEPLNMLYKCDCLISNEDVIGEINIYKNENTFDLFIVIKYDKDKEKKDFKFTPEDMEFKKNSNIFSINHNNENIEINVINNENLKRIFNLCGDKTLNDTNETNTECSNSSDDPHNLKPNTKRGPETNLNEIEQEDDSNHITKKPKVSNNTD